MTWDLLPSQFLNVISSSIKTEVVNDEAELLGFYGALFSV